MIARWFVLSVKRTLQEGLHWLLDRSFFYERPFTWIKARFLNGLLGAQVASDCTVMPGVRAVDWSRVRIDAGAYLAAGANLRSYGPIDIGRWTIIGPEAMLASGGHSVVDLAPTHRPITIGQGVFVGARAVILEGVTIGDHAIIGAGAVVTRDVPRLAIAAGNPAAVLSYREEPKEVWTIGGMVDLSVQTPPPA